MEELNIVLIEPEIPQNTGNIARTCAATGARLHLVKPFGFVISDKNLKRAGLDYWKYVDITYYENQNDFFDKNRDAEFYYFTTKALNIHSSVNYPNKAFLVFGKETKGLDENLLINNRERCVRIPMINEARSLNLSNSVAIATYEVLRQWDYPKLLTKGELHNHKW